VIPTSSAPRRCSDRERPREGPKNPYARGLILKRDSASAKPTQLFSVPEALLGVRDCINAQANVPKRRNHGWIAMYDLARPRGECMWFRMDTVRSASIENDSLLRDSNVVSLPLPAKSYGKAIAEKYALRYRPNGPTPAAGFDLFAFPLRYHAGSIRSFALLQDGSLHVTTENRLATASDPQPLACEVDLKVRCAER